MLRPAAVALLLAVLAGCGDEDPPAVVRVAVAQAKLPPTARYAVSLDLSSAGSGGRVEAEGVGSADGRTIDVEGEFDVDGERSESVRLRVLGDDVWEAGGPSKWVHARDRSARFDALGLGVVTRTLRRSRTLRVVGREALDGERVTRLRAGGLDVWVGEDRLIRRSRLRRGEGDAVEVVVHEVLEPGVRLDVRPPPAAEVVEAAAGRR